MILPVVSTLNDLFFLFLFFLVNQYEPSEECFIWLVNQIDVNTKNNIVKDQRLYLTHHYMKSA
jgi:hypothetical protein